MFTFLHVADIHLDSPLRGLDRYEGAPVAEMRGATRRAFENLVELALEQRVDFLIVAGDVYDGDWQDFNTGLFFVKQMSRLREAGIPVVLVSGNHDAANKITRALQLPDNVKSLSVRKPETVLGKDIGFGLENLDVAFHGQGFRSAAIEENVVLDYPVARRGLFNIGVLHTSLDMEAGGEHARYAPCAVADLLAREYDYWALGHIHKRRMVHADPPIAFPGNMQGRHIRETGEKGCLLVTVDDRGRPRCEFQSLDVFRWAQVTVSADKAQRGDDVLDGIAAELHQAVAEAGNMPLAVRVIVVGRTAAHFELAASPSHWTNQVRALGMSLGDGCVWIEKVKFQTSALAEVVATDDGPLQEIVACLSDLRADDERLGRLAEDLLPLARKLPSELTDEETGQETLRPDDPSWLRSVLNEVEPLLIARLSPQEDSP